MLWHGWLQTSTYSILVKAFQFLWVVFHHALILCYICNWLEFYHIRPIHDLPSHLQVCFLFSRFSHESHKNVSKQILGYIKDTTNFGFQYTLGASQLVGFTDFDWVGLVDDQTSHLTLSITLDFLLLPSLTRSNQWLHYIM